jgi:putative peptidoglycan lipid II flippase
VQCVIAATNITLAVLLTGGTGPEDTAAGLVLAYGGAYLVGVAGSYLLLRHVLGGLDTPLLVRFLVRLVVAVGLAAVVGFTVRAGVAAVLAPGDVQAIVSVALVTLSGAVVYLLVSRALRIAEVNAVVGLVTARLGR